jgi:hypothetical protein
MYRFDTEKTEEYGHVVLTNDKKTRIYIDSKENDSKYPVISPYRWDLNYREIIDSGLVTTPHGNIDFSKGFLFERNDLLIPIVSSFLNYKIDIVPNLNIFSLLNDMYRPVYNKKVSDLLDISCFDEQQKKDFNEGTFPLIVGLETDKMPYYDSNTDKKVNEDSIRFLGRDKKDNLHLGYCIKSFDGRLISGEFVINEIILSRDYQWIYMPSIVFLNAVDFETGKKVVELIFKEEPRWRTRFARS